MAHTDARIDAYIAKSAPYARPILERLRRAIHKGCPEVVETVKWNNPSFEHEGLLCGIAAFKSYCTFGLWKDELVRARAGASAAPILDALGNVASIEDLPPDAAIVKLVRLAADLNERGIKVERPKAAPKGPVTVPTDLRAALGKNKKARATFEGFPPSHKREYVEWITEAKQEATRQRRLEQAIVWMAEGKVRNWKYVR